MNIDHVFICFQTDNKVVTGIAAIRCDHKEKVLAGFCAPIKENSISELNSIIFDTRFSDNYVIVHKGWQKLLGLSKGKDLDILQLAWPIWYNGIISSASFPELCRHFGFQAGSNAAENCEALVKTYWALMRRYRTALSAEEIARDLGGQTLSKLRGIIGY